MSKVDIQHAVDVLSNLAQSEGDVGYEYWMNIIKLLQQPPAEPIAAQARYHWEESWTSCTIEHHHFVQRHKDKFQDYETRLLYSAPVQQPPAVPDGYALVPVEPTLEMMEAAKEADFNHDSFEDWMFHDGEDIRYIYRAMLAAAKGGA